MKKILTLLLVATGAVVAVVGTMGWFVVAPGEVVLVRRLGRLVGPPWGPGLHWRFPLGIDQIDRVRSDAVRQITVGLAEAAAPDVEPSAGEVLTGDLNLLRFQATVQYRVAGPVEYALRAEKVEPLVARAAEASVTRALAVRGVDAVLRTDRQAIAREVERELQSITDRYQSGVSILGVSLTDARPPNEVVAAFASAQSAESERDRRVNEALGYDETTTTAARAAAIAKRDAAYADAQRTILLAHADAQRFHLLRAEVESARSLTERRLYIETVQSLLSGVKRRIVLPHGENIDLTVLGLDAQLPSPTGQERDTDQQQVPKGEPKN
jgi:membrane protease subunit HflK